MDSDNVTIEELKEKILASQTIQNRLTDKLLNLASELDIELNPDWRVLVTEIIINLATKVEQQNEIIKELQRKSE